MGLVAWIVFGLLAGALARAAFPGHRPGGIVATLLLGLGGAVVGGLIASLLGLGGITGFDLWSLLVAIAGAVLLILVYQAATADSGTSRP
jgi:uncharacterized membrane protein YeaQ/YmgE (transglycosylase-associated protein family)